MKNINQKEWQELLAQDTNAVIIDVRTPGECATGIIENACLVDYFNAATFEAYLQTLDRNKNYYVYCRSGNRSGQACLRIQELGAINVHNLAGGMLAWTGKTVIPA